MAKQRNKTKKKKCWSLSTKKKKREKGKKKNSSEQHHRHYSSRCPTVPCRGKKHHTLVYPKPSHKQPTNARPNVQSHHPVCQQSTECPVRAPTAAAKRVGVRGCGVAKGGSSRKGRRGGCLVSAFGQTTFSAPSPLKDQEKIPGDAHLHGARVKKGTEIGWARTKREQLLSKERHNTLSCPSTGIPGARGRLVAAAALPMTGVSHEVPQTADKTSLLRVAVGGLPLPLSRMPLLPKTGSQPESPASQKNEPEMPLACP